MSNSFDPNDTSWPVQDSKESVSGGALPPLRSDDARREAERPPSVQPVNVVDFSLRAPLPVMIIDFRLPFGRIVGLIVILSLAAIPAGLIIFAIYFLAAAFFAGMMGHR